MRHEKLFEPIDASEPCGPDLDEIGDDDYLNYVLPAEDRLPIRFFDKETGAPFDRSTIDLRAEVKTIEGLLEKSRDLRLLTLEARFQILAGQIVGFCESIQAIAGLVARFWADVHPLGNDDDFTLRQNTLASLDDRIKIILPLQFATIVRDRRFGNISYRLHAVASGQAQPRGDEKRQDPGAIIDALATEENRQGVEAVHAAVSAAQTALKSIGKAFVDGAGHDYQPSFDGLLEALGQISGLIEKAVPSLVEAPAAEPEQETEEAHEETAADASVPQAKRAPDAPPPAVANQAEAAAALLAAEIYFTAKEPSAPALILIRQARTLIGKPLTAVLEALVPQTAEQAMIRFDGGFKFQLDMPRMRSLSAPAQEAVAETAPAGVVREFAADTRAQASALIAGVEQFFRAAEPSSPVPMLLAKARGYMDRDFLAILKEMMTV